MLLDCAGYLIVDIERALERYAMTGRVTLLLAIGQGSSGVYRVAHPKYM